MLGGSVVIALMRIAVDDIVYCEDRFWGKKRVD